MVEVRTEAHIFRSQVGIGSESDCLLGQLKRILDISDSEAGLKEEKPVLLKNWVIFNFAHSILNEAEIMVETGSYVVTGQMS